MVLYAQISRKDNTKRGIAQIVVWVHPLSKVNPRYTTQLYSSKSYKLI